MSDSSPKDGRDTLDEITKCLVDSINLRGVSRWKLPGKILVARESLLWRLEELGQNAFETLDAGRFVASALATRGIMETAAAIVFLHAMMRKVIETGMTEAIVGKLDRLLINSKVWEELEDPIHINDMLREVEKVIPGFMDEHYAALSEFAHPNWRGTFGAFGEFDKINFVGKFKKGGRNPENQLKTLSSYQAATLGIAKYYYELVGNDLNAFIASIEKFYAENPPPIAE